MTSEDQADSQEGGSERISAAGQSAFDDEVATKGSIAFAGLDEPNQVRITVSSRCPLNVPGQPMLSYPLALTIVLLNGHIRSSRTTNNQRAQNRKSLGVVELEPRTHCSRRTHRDAILYHCSADRLDLFIKDQGR